MGGCLFKEAGKYRYLTPPKVRCMNQYQIAVIVGSLRKDSFNRKLADAIVKLAPPEFSFRQCARSATCRCITRTMMSTRLRRSYG